MRFFLKDRGRLVFLLVIMFVAIMAAVGNGVISLYHTAIREQEQRLAEIVSSQARLIESVARFDALHSAQEADFPGGAKEATISQVVDFHKNFGGIGRTGEYLMGRLVDDQIVFLLDLRHLEAPSIFSVPLDSDRAEPMRLALTGAAGTIVARDYRGERVLAAYEPIAILDLGLVAKIDLAEVRAPYIRAGATAFILALFLAMGGAFLFWRVAHPIVQRVQKSEQRLKHAQRIAKLGNMEWDVSLNKLYWSDEVYAIYGLSPEETDLSAEIFDEMVHPEDRAKVHSRVKTTLRSGDSYSLDYRIIRKDGAVRHIHEDGEIIHEGGNPKYIRSTIQDITDRVTATEAISEREGRHRAVVNNISEAIIIIDSKGLIESFNPAAEKIFGYQAQEVIGQNVKILMGKQDAQDHDPHITAYLKTGVGKIIGNPPREVKARKKDGAFFSADLAVNDMVLGDKRLFVGVMRDVTERKKFEAQLVHMANYDPLTGLPNRTLMTDRLNQAIANAQRHDEIVAVIFLDLDRFKLINDIHGHSMGDQVLVEMGQRLIACIRETDTVSHVAGDEFIIILTGLHDAAEAMLILDNISAAVTETLKIESLEFFITASMGVSLFPRDGEDAQTLVKNADAAMHNSKDEGKNNFSFFTPELNQRAQVRLEMEQKLRLAIEREEFELYYQPKENLETGRIDGMEALIRWIDPVEGLVPPDRFIPLAEETGLIVPIGEWVLKTACAHTVALQEELGRPLKVAVNVSGRQFREKNLKSRISAILGATGLPPENLEVEMTESLVMLDVEANTLLLNELKEMGISVAVDDFGTGYSSLSYLKNLPIDVIKIDRAFVKDIYVDPEDRAIVRAILSLAKSLNLKVVAEGVEEREQASYLRLKGCDEMQGYLVSRPVPFEDFKTFLKARPEK